MWMQVREREKSIFHFCDIVYKRPTIVDNEIFSLPSRFNKILVFFLVHQIINIFFFFKVTGIVI